MTHQEQATELRKTVLKMTHKAQSSHIGSNFSCADLLTVIYDIADLSLVDGRTKDTVIVKSWAAANVYACLVAKGLLPQDAIDHYGEDGTPWTTILDSIPPYIPAGTGAMGYHLPFAVGFALAKKLKGQNSKVYCLISDGELGIGSTWESAAIAKQQKLDNIVLVIDRNSLQAMGETKDILDMEPIDAKFRAFGWEVQEISGHNHREIQSALTSKMYVDRPKVIIARTVKGKGVSFMEGDNIWHYSHVNAETLELALAELDIISEM